MTPSKLGRIRRIAAGGLVLAAAASLLLIASRARSAPAPAAREHAERVARGEYLVTVAGCHDCHTPWTMGENGPEPDMSRALSGHPHDFPVDPLPLPDSGQWGMAMAATNTAFSGAWGVSFAANLTPCEDTGIGVWSDEIFVNTLRTGRHWGQSRPILPPMPWPNFAQMTDEDLKSVFAYLRTLPARRNPVPLPLPPGGVAAVSQGLWD